MERKEIFAEICRLSNLEYVFKFTEIYFSHRLHVHSFRVFSDIRPVFDSSADDVIGAVVKNVVSINYSDSNEDESNLELAIRIDELTELRDEVDRAIRKSKLLETLLRERLSLPTEVYEKE